MPDLPAFTYTRPRDLTSALVAIGRPGACIFAGGTDVLVALGERRPWVGFVREIVDIKDLPEAQGVVDLGPRLRIGALVTADALATHRAVRRYARVLAEAAEQSSAPVLRRRGTVGGNISTPHPAGDMTTALLALDATVEVADRKTIREVPLTDFMQAQAEHWPRQQLILGVTVRKCRHSAFEKIGSRAAFSRSLVAAAVAAIDERLRIALGGLRERPFLFAETTASVARGAALDTALAVQCGPPAGASSGDGHRLRLAATLIRRAVARVRP